jgi:DNA-binding transcriptional LysR family regulator
MVTRRIGAFTLGLFGARAYFGNRPIPTTFDEFLTHDIVGYDRNDDIIRGFREVGIEVSREFFPVRTDNQTVYWELVRAGCGLGFAHRKHGLDDPELVEIPLPVEIPSLEIWLTAHESVRRSPRVDRVWTFLADRLAEECDDPTPAS